MKNIVGVGLCIIGIVVWIAPLFAALGIVNPTVLSLGVITGGAIIMSGIAFICLPNHPKRVPYFDKGP
jgi:energy-converting hydrogenase Eha subunit G